MPEKRYCEYCGTLLADCQCYNDVSIIEDDSDGQAAWFKRHEAKMIKEGKYKQPTEYNYEDGMCDEYNRGW